MIIYYDRETCNWNEVLAEAWRRRPRGETGTIICMPRGCCLAKSHRTTRRKRGGHNQGSDSALGGLKANKEVNLVGYDAALENDFKR